MEALIKKAKDGDRHALATLIDTHKTIAFNLALKITNSEEEAKDITQESFLTVLENIKKFRNEAKFSTWLYRIVYNEALRVIKRKSVPIEGKHADALATESTDSLEQRESRQRLDAAIQELNENERVVILLFYMAEKTIKEITSITGFTESNTKVLLHRGRKQLKERLENEHQEKS
ncbi:sigma-70 family RNA polymerase sigma factor [Pontibacter diazotrophicus]|uniref:Sigma-70 family RNA polymerase sigma factor n=1 Tax=Pontibacter diazotrophicus TaxID=1400979 RepID=A0A3D8KYF2_9BACT|nr:sigma-70 family RNA polymerase sigma factor [Pontibacter diazotrophicus]RDV10248.1 sigma-70 family RNA polymerase sigma factor [Pontibacter diazotrophicus]